MNYERFYRQLIEDYRADGKMSSADHYEDTLRAFLRRKGEITPRGIKMFIAACRDDRNSEFTIAGYIQNLKHVWKLYAKKNGIAADPFDGIKGTTTARTTKQPLSSNEIELLEDVQLKKRDHIIARDFFIFCHHNLGMRMKDALYMKVGDISNGNIKYVTSKSKKFFNFQISPVALGIYQRYSTGKRASDFLFPYFKQDHSYESYRKAKDKINRDLKTVAKIAGVLKPLSTHIARHSFAEKVKELPTTLQKDLLGHSSIITTMNYMKSFGSQEISNVVKNVFG